MLKIFSLNIWNLNDDFSRRMEIIDNYLFRSKPEIICLQEVSIDPLSGVPQTSCLRKILRESSILYSTQGKWDDREEGLATLTTLPIVAFESFMLPDVEGDMQRRVQFTVLSHFERNIVIANTHLAYHLDSNTGRAQQCAVIIDHLQRITERYETKNIVLAGDLNTIPNSEPMNVLLNSPLNLTDCFEGSEYRRTRYTFPVESPYSNSNLWPNRWIDYALFSPSLRVNAARLVLDGKETGEFASDHAALEVSFELNE